MFLPAGATTDTCSVCGFFSCLSLCFGHLLAPFFFDYRAERLQHESVVLLFNMFVQMEFLKQHFCSSCKNRSNETVVGGCCDGVCVCGTAVLRRTPCSDSSADTV